MFMAVNTRIFLNDTWLISILAQDFQMYGIVQEKFYKYLTRNAPGAFILSGHLCNPKAGLLVNMLYSASGTSAPMFEYEYTLHPAGVYGNTFFLWG